MHNSGQGECGRGGAEMRLRYAHTINRPHAHIAQLHSVCLVPCGLHMLTGAALFHIFHHDEDVPVKVGVFL